MNTFGKITAALAAIKDYLAAVGADLLQTQSGEIDCPNCAGRLKFSRMPGNGHVFGFCGTKACLGNLGMAGVPRAAYD